MRLLALVSFLAFIGSCAFTGQQKAERIIKSYLDTTLNDPHSYESVSFGKLDTIYSAPANDSIYKKLESEIEKRGVRLIMLEKYGMDSTEANEHYHSVDYDDDLLKIQIKDIKTDSIHLEKTVDSLTRKHKQLPYFFQLTHTYRAKNQFGALTVKTSIFWISPNFKEIFLKRSEN